MMTTADGVGCLANTHHTEALYAVQCRVKQQGIRSSRRCSATVQKCAKINVKETDGKMMTSLTCAEQEVKSYERLESVVSKFREHFTNRHIPLALRSLQRRTDLIW